MYVQKEGKIMTNETLKRNSFIQATERRYESMTLKEAIQVLKAQESSLADIEMEIGKDNDDYKHQLSVVKEWKRRVADKRA